MSAFRHQIHDAAKRGNIEDIKRLLKDNPDLINDKGEDEWTPLFRAAYNGRLPLVKFLVEEGASLSMDSDECQNTPLHATAINGHIEVAEYLLERGADVNAHVNLGKWTPLFAASYFGNENIVRLLMRHGADPDISNKEGMLPYDVACEAGYRKEHKQAIQALLKNRPVPEITSPVRRRSSSSAHESLGRISLNSLAAPVSTVAANPPSFIETKSGNRIYFPWELTTSDYSKRGIDCLQEVLLQMFSKPERTGAVPPLPPPCAKAKPYLDAYDLLNLGYEHEAALASYFFLEQGGDIPTIEEFQSELHLHFEILTTLLHRTSYGKEDIERLLQEVQVFADFLGEGELRRQVLELEEHFKAHMESKLIRMESIRSTQKLVEMYEKDTGNHPAS